MAPLTLALEAAALRTEVARLKQENAIYFESIKLANVLLDQYKAEKELLEQERDAALYELDRLRAS